MPPRDRGPGGSDAAHAGPLNRKPGVPHWGPGYENYDRRLPMAVAKRLSDAGVAPDDVVTEGMDAIVVGDGALEVHHWQKAPAVPGEHQSMRLVSSRVSLKGEPVRVQHIAANGEVVVVTRDDHDRTVHGVPIEDLRPDRRARR